MAWQPSKYRILAGLVDVRAFDDDGVAFVRKTIDRLRETPVELDDLEYQLRAMGELRKEFWAELLIAANPKAGDLYVLVCQAGRVTTRSAREAPDAMGRISARGGVKYRLAGAGYTLERLAEVEKIAERRDRTDVQRLLEYLKYANQPTPSEQELRLAIYDAIAWHEQDDVRRALLRALADEPDEVAAFVIEVMHHQAQLLDEMPGRIDQAWQSGDRRLAKRMLAALVKADDERKHDAWVREKYPEVARELDL